MFLRFRKVITDRKNPTDGYALDCQHPQPTLLDRSGEFLPYRHPCDCVSGEHCRLVWVHRLENRRGRRARRCPYFVGSKGQIELTPYRLDVSLVECLREYPRVIQSHVAALGSLRSVWLPEFWAGMPLDVALEIQGKEWEARAREQRGYFWEGVNERLARLDNRLNKAETAAFRARIERRVPKGAVPTLEELAERRARADEALANFAEVLRKEKRK